MKRVIAFLLFLILGSTIFAQTDSSSYTLYRDRLVLHTSLSINDAPFSIKGSFKNATGLKYRSNLNLTHGIGVAYKWFALNLNYKIPGYLRSTEKYGKTKYFNLGLKFNLKHWYFSLNGYLYVGYAIPDLSNFSDTLNVSSAGYYLNNNLTSFSVDLNAYYFFSKDLNMRSAMGIVGRYTRAAKGLYLRMTASYQSLADDQFLIPQVTVNSEKSLYTSSSIGAMGIGAIPGYAYLNNINGWQFGVFAGLGLILQAKSYTYSTTTRSFLGISPRLDFSTQGGYNVENWFLMLSSSFNQRYFGFNKFKFNQYYYYIKLTYGYRFKRSKHKK